MTPPLRERLSGGVPSVAVAFADTVTDATLAAFADRGLDVAEVRIDRFSSTAAHHVVDQVRRMAAALVPVPTVATIRSQVEGGAWQGSDDERLGLFEQILPLVDAVDVEGSSLTIRQPVVAAARAQDKVVIVSYHDFDRTPPVDRLEQTAATARHVGADHVKVATLARSSADLRRLAAFTMGQAAAGVIAFAMGELGPASRVLLPLLGSVLTYASAADGEAMAPGQMSFEETAALLRRFSPEYAATHPPA